MVFKILNLYAGIGGNRRLWGDKYEITAVEYDKNIASVYKEFYPNDILIIDDAHKFLLEHYSEFDFIWSSPPCPTHSRLRFATFESNNAKPVYPDMRLYEEIIFLQYYFKKKYCIENVISYYEPLIKPQKIGRHYYWTNFIIKQVKDIYKNDFITADISIKDKMKLKGVDLSKFKGIDKKKVLNNMVNSYDGWLILNSAINEYQKSLL
jgi:DNA (cytosine-5)-methyltransferase 1